MRAGAKSCERTPLLGDAFLISAMMAGGRAARAARKSRRAGRRSAASRSHASSGWAVRARSWRFLATIRARMSGTVSIKGVDPMVSETLGGNGEVGSVSEPRKAAGAGGVVTQNPRVECISRGWVSPFSAWGCGVGGRFCDANGSIIRTPPEVWQPEVWAPMVMNGCRVGRWVRRLGRRKGRWILMVHAYRRFEVSIGARRIPILGTWND